MKGGRSRQGVRGVCGQAGLRPHLALLHTAAVAQRQLLELRPVLEHEALQLAHLQGGMGKRGRGRGGEGAQIERG